MRRSIAAGWVTWCVAVVLAVATPMAALGQTLADRVPKDAMVYIGWAGAANLGPAYEQSNLKGVLDASNLPQQLRDLFKQMMDKAAQRDPKGAEGAKLVHALVDAVSNNPSALYFGGVDFTDPDNPMPRMALIVQTGKSGEALAAALAKSLDERPEAEKKVPGTAKMVGDFLLLGIGKTDSVETVLGQTGDRAALALSGDEAFVAATKEVVGNAPLTVYANLEAGVQMIEEAALQRGNGANSQMVPVMFNALGLHAFKRLMITSSFDQKDWATSVFVAMDAKRPVVAGLVANPPLDEEALKAIPKAAVSARVIRFDGARLLAEIRDAANTVMPPLVQQMDQGIQRVNMVMGIDVEKDLLGSLGDSWFIYDVPDTATNSGHDVIVINKLKDEAAATRALEGLQDFGNGLIAMRFGAERALTREDANGVTMHTAHLPQFAPSWAIKGGYFAFSFSPHGVQTALEAAAAKSDGGLPANEAFTTLRKRLNVAQMTSFRFNNLPETAAQGYETWTQLLAQASAFAQNDGVTLPTLPPLEKIKPFLSPVMAAAWSDEAGYHMRSVEPFPGSILLSAQDANVIQTAIGAAAPAVGRARGRAQDIAVSNNLRQLGMAAQMYAADNGGTLPPDLGTLLSKGYLGEKASPQVFVRAGTTVPADVLTQSKEDQAAWINKNTSYEYTGAGKKTADIANPGLAVLAYEKLDLPTSKERVAILFLDGHVENVDRARAEELVGAK